VKRWHIIALSSVLLIGVLTVVGYHVGVRLLQARIIEALGPGSSIAELKVNWFSVEVLGLSIEAPTGWPAARTLQVERLKLFPSLLSLFTHQIHIASIIMERPYLSVVRSPGKFVALPNMTAAADGKKKGNNADSSRRGVTVAKVELQDGVLELFDSTVRRPLLETRLEQIDGVIRDISSPWLATKIKFELAAIVKGIRRDGRAQASGWVGPGRRDSSSRIELDAVDLVSLQPYLVKNNEAQVINGMMDLTLNSEVRDNKIDGKGKVSLRDLKFSSRGLFDTFMGIPRSAVINFLNNHDNAINLNFTLQGDASHPNFSVNEALTTRIAAAMAEQLGVNIRGVVEGVGTLGRRGAETAEGAPEGVGTALRGLFGGTKK
jgi:uncharacterized protein involved in outer membrane biogenesis